MPKSINNIQGYQLRSSTNSVFVFERKGHFIVIDNTPLKTTNPYFQNTQEVLSSFKLNSE